MGQYLDLAGRPGPSEDPLDATGVVFACRELGVRLSLTESADGILARPTEALTPELATAITEHEDEILRDLYFRKAMLWLDQRMKDLGAKPCDPDRDVAWSTLCADESADSLNEVWLDADIEEFRMVLKSHVHAALSAFREARGLGGRGSPMKEEEMAEGREISGAVERSVGFAEIDGPEVELYEGEDGALILWRRGEPVAHYVTMEVGEATFLEDALRLVLRGSDGWTLPAVGEGEDWGECRAIYVAAYGVIAVIGAPGGLAREYLGADCL